MKKLFFLIATALLATNMMAQLVPTVVIKGDPRQYKYVHVIPTSGTTSSTGVSTTVHIWGPIGITAGNANSTVNPSELLTGFLMKEGYTVVPSITPELADMTLIVSYGFLGTYLTRKGGVPYSRIILQMTDASTHEVVVSYETIGTGDDDAERISEALDYAIDLFQYTIHPRVAYYTVNTYATGVNVRISNRTIDVVTEVSLRLTYYLHGEIVHTQDVSIGTSLAPAYSTETYIKRDKGFHGYKYKVQVEIIDFK